MAVKHSVHGRAAHVARLWLIFRCWLCPSTVLLTPLRGQLTWHPIQLDFSLALGPSYPWLLFQVVLSVGLTFCSGLELCESEQSA